MTKTMPKPTEPVSTEMSAVKTASEVIHLALEKSEKMLPEGEYLKLANALKKANEDLTKDSKVREMKVEGIEICGTRTLTGLPVSAKLVHIRQQIGSGPWKVNETWELSVGDEPPVSVPFRTQAEEFFTLHEPYELVVKGLGPTFTASTQKVLRQITDHEEEERRERDWDDEDFFVMEEHVYHRFMTRLGESALKKLARAFPTDPRGEV